MKRILKSDKSELSFSKAEYQREYNNIDYVPPSGCKIWKYCGQKSASTSYLMERNVKLFVMIFFAMLITFVFSMLTLSMKEGYYENVLNWISVGIIIVMAVGVCTIASSIGRKTQSMQIAFARDINGTLYLFDYQSPEFQQYIISKFSIIGTITAVRSLFSLSYLYNNEEDANRIELIDKVRVIEGIMDSGNMYPYGKEISQIKSIKKGRNFSRIYLTLLELDGKEQHTSINLPKTYLHYEELINNLNRIKMYGYEVERCTVCQKRLINGRCPECGTVICENTTRKFSKFRKYEETLRLLNIFFAILCISSVIACVATRVYIEKHETFNYKKVNVIVLSYDSILHKYYTEYDVKVSYEGKSYQLHNPDDSTWYYFVGNEIKAYLYKGQLYANQTVIKGTGTLGTLYFVFLFGSLILLVVSLTIKYIRKEIRMAVI